MSNIKIQNGLCRTNLGLGPSHFRPETIFFKNVREQFSLTVNDALKILYIHSAILDTNHESALLQSVSGYYT